MEQTFTAEEFKEKMYSNLKVRPSDSVILMCSIFIASIGLNMNSIPIIIGAMLISPLMTPILSIGLALSLYDMKLLRAGVRLLLVQVFVSLTVATIYFAISPITYPSNEIIARTEPTIWDVIIAFAGGTAGIIGAQKKMSNNIVPGVAIATALMPPLCTVGYSIATRNLDYLIGSSYLFIINCSFIAIATFIGVKFMGISQELTKQDVNHKKINRLLIGLSVLIVLPSIASATTLVQDSIIRTGINNFVENEFSDAIIISQDYEEDQKQLLLTTTGKRISEEELAELDAKLPEYGLNSIELTVTQVPDFTELSGEQATRILQQYLESRLQQFNLFDSRQIDLEDLPFELQNELNPN
ncbi:TIGR00341 family protein [Exiguobacterium algae]|uniref:TIGR00341 family protein n=1 Tax=Exiguobacterium algae TaxID=2751250 RepID=UPI001BEA302D|nr:TIGR00341 family protein [Exiguobacterium algae]